MRYFEYSEPDNEGNPEIKILSEEEILKNYWPYWHTQMCKKFGKEEVDKNYSFSDCLEDWVMVNWATEIK